MRGDPDRRCARITNTMIKFMHTFELPGMHTTMARGLALLLDTRHLSPFSRSSHSTIPIKHPTNFNHFPGPSMSRAVFLFGNPITERENAFLGSPVAGAAPSPAKCASSTIAFSQLTR